MKPKSDVLGAIKIPQEDEVRDALLGLPFARNCDLGTGPATDADYAHELAVSLRAGAELTRQSYSTLFQLVESARERLHLSCEVRCFKGLDGGDENATVWSHGDKVLLTFVSGILSTVDRPEGLQTIIGHELGHHGYFHSDDPGLVLGALLQDRMRLESSGALNRSEKALLSALSGPEADEAFFMFTVLSQLRELNADRAGLLAMPHLEANLEGEMLLTAGRADRYGRHDAESFLRQGRELIRMGGALEEGSVETHPIGPLRAIAMEYFWRSDRFRDLTGTGPANVRLEDFSKVLHRLLPFGELQTKFASVPISRKLPPFLLEPPNLRGSQDHPAGMAPMPSRAATEGAQPRGLAGTPSDVAPVVSAPMARPSASAIQAAEWVEAEPIDDEAPGGAALTAEEKARVAFLLAESVAVADGKLSRAEATFLQGLVRPRSLSERLLAEYRADPDLFVDAGEPLLDKARSAAGKTKASLVRTMIQAAKADRKIDDDEIRAILDLADRIDASAAAERELRNAFGSRLDDVRAGPSPA